MPNIRSPDLAIVSARVLPVVEGDRRVRLRRDLRRRLEDDRLDGDAAAATLDRRDVLAVVLVLVQLVTLLDVKLKVPSFLLVEKIKTIFG